MCINNLKIERYVHRYEDVIPRWAVGHRCIVANALLRDDVRYPVIPWPATNKPFLTVRISIFCFPNSVHFVKIKVKPEGIWMQQWQQQGRANSNMPFPAPFPHQQILWRKLSFNCTWNISVPFDVFLNAISKSLYLFHRYCTRRLSSRRVIGWRVNRAYLHLRHCSVLKKKEEEERRREEKRRRRRKKEEDFYY